MRCKRVCALVPEYLDGRLPAEKILQIENHLTECAGCRRELDAFTRTTNALEQPVSTFTPPDILSAIKEQVSCGERKTFPAFGRYAIAAAAVVIVISITAVLQTPVNQKHSAEIATTHEYVKKSPVPDMPKWEAKPTVSTKTEHVAKAVPKSVVSHTKALARKQAQDSSNTSDVRITIVDAETYDAAQAQARTRVSPTVSPSPNQLASEPEQSPAIARSGIPNPLALSFDTYRSDVPQTVHPNPPFGDQENYQR